MNARRVAVLIFLLIAVRAGCAECIERDLVYRDEARSRDIPTRLYAPTGMGAAQKLALISGGYGVPESAYGFLAHELVRRGFVVVSVQHSLPTDEPLAMSGDLYQLRLPVWTRGVENLKFVISELKRKYPALDTRHLVLVGHSNGGDISCLFESRHPADVESVVTLDHRRMPIPRVRQPRFLSIRADEYGADAGVLPSAEDQDRLNIRIVRLKNTKHMALTDEGPADTKAAVAQLVGDFVQGVPNQALPATSTNNDANSPPAPKACGAVPASGD